MPCVLSPREMAADFQTISTLPRLFFSEMVPFVSRFVSFPSYGPMVYLGTVIEQIRFLVQP